MTSSSHYFRLQHTMTLAGRKLSEGEGEAQHLT